MSRCEQELCENWTGDGCACDVFGIERPPPTCTCGGSALLADECEREKWWINRVLSPSVPSSEGEQE